ncbi:MAG: class I tRNA ligase family protein, partial [Eubacteriaceae bacterium]
APHITEEIWKNLGFKGYLHNEPWPSYDESKLIDDVIQIPVQINGKLRGVIDADKDATQEEIKQIIIENKNISAFLEGKTVVKEIYVPGKIYTIVVK